MKKEKCSFCSGTGACPACGGVGSTHRYSQYQFIKDHYPCMTCNGSGRCPTCGGAGFIYEDGKD